MRKLVCLLVGLMMVLTMVGAYAESTTGPHIGFAYNNANADLYGTAYYNELVRYAEEINANLSLLDSAGDIPTQIRQIEDLIEQKVDVLIVWPNDVNSVFPGVKKASEAGIPVVVCQSLTEEAMQYVTAFVGADNYEEGVMIGEAVVAHFADHPDTVNVVEVAHRSGILQARERAAGFRAAIEGHNIEILESHSAEGSRETATQIMEGYITKYGDDIDMVYNHGDSFAIGVLNAIKDAGKAGQFVVTGIALNRESYERMETGELTYDVVESPLGSARTMLDTATAIGNGEEVPPIVHIPIELVDQNNYMNVERPTW